MKSLIANDEKRDRGQRFVAQHVVKDRFKLRDDEDEEENHDPDGENEHDDRIDHRGDDLVLDLLRLLLEFREPGQHQLEHTTRARPL